MAVALTSPADDTRLERASRSEELIYLFFVLWTMVGLCLDGWAHRYQPELESFFTPWHAVFYSGFIGGSAWLATMIGRRLQAAGSFRAAIPDGYELAVVGLAVFAVGGIGDGFWHTILGVETGIDALLSPTHLLMLIGMLGGATAPIRAAWRDPASAVGGVDLRAFLPVVLSTAVATTGVAFFFLYANGFSNWQLQNAYVEGRSDVLVSSGIFSTLASTVILLTPVLLLLRRWRPPFGTFTLMFAVVGVFMAGLDAYEYWWQIIPPVVGGLTTDAVVARPGAAATSAAARRRTAWLVGLIVPMVMWSVSTLVIHLAWSVAWPPELWVGQIVMASLAGLGLAILSHPPSGPDSVIPSAGEA